MPKQIGHKTKKKMETDAKQTALESQMKGLTLQLENFQDIKHDLEKASEDIKVGELIHRAGFRMSDALLSIEMMDPKMDAGVGSGQSLPFDERLSRGLIPFDLGNEQLIAVLDELLCLEMAWYDGLPIVQTLFTCLYMHRPSAIPNKFLRIFCEAQLKSCEQIRTLVGNAQVYEDEDFIGHSFGFGFGDIKLSEISGVMNGLEDEEIANIKNLKKLKTEPDQNVEEIQKEITHKEALLARLRLRRALFSLHMHFDKRDGFKAETVKKSIAFAQTQIPILRQTHSSAPLPEGIIDKKINFRLLGPNPLKEVRQISFESAMDMFEKMLQNMERSLSLLTLTSLDDIKLFFEHVVSHFSDIISRSRVSLLWSSDSRAKTVLGNVSIDNLIISDMVQKGYAREKMEHASVKQFLETAAPALINLFRIFCHNRGRQRRKFLDVVPDWITVQEQATKVDESLTEVHPRFREPFSIWTAHLKSLVVKNVVFLGFDLELYHPAELTVISWWMSVVFRSTVHIKVLTFPGLNAGLRNNPQMKKKEKAFDVPQSVSISTHLEEGFEFYYQAFVHIVHGVFVDPRFKGQKPSVPHGSLEDIFDHRAAPFDNFRFPMPVGFDSFMKFLNHTLISSLQSYFQAYQSLVRAKEAFEKVAKMANLPPELSAEILLARKSEAALRLSLGRIMSPEVDEITKLNYSFNHHKNLPIASINQ